ncbi:ABC transporter permease [Microlunatus sp. Gsoil 973]|uniref:ABC transporter permease n=1 Tax=Microlunatus sp. Gsoil 973 TaxID=2672569 RepID=UPI0012B44094|nr:ABC transporter permease [Microlunatus sp. Gsoil 973]QGN35176.1 ABC transporter permease [Microlunatus sp. Gsoil 973]
MRAAVREIITTLVAILLALIVGAILMVVSDADVIGKYAYFAYRPGDAVAATLSKVGGTYLALVKGAVGGLGPITETTAQAAPLIFAGLGVALAFRAGLINIGGQGQAVWGAIFAAYIGFAVHLPLVIHVVVALIAGVIGGAIWGGIVGWLKARTGAHEVIVTIMLNYVATGMLSWLLTTSVFRRPGRTDPISPVVDWTATFARLEGTQLHVGFFLALAAAVGVWWILERSTVGFVLKAVGSNPNAAATAGMSVGRAIVIAMVLAGALAGLAGVNVALAPSDSGVPVPLTNGIVGTVGFDAVTVALLGRSRPLGVVLAGLLFGALHAGGLGMQSIAQTPLTLTTVLQALIVLFVAAPALIGKLLPFLRGRQRTGTPESTGALT